MPTDTSYISQRQVGSPAAIAGRPAPTGIESTCIASRLTPTRARAKDRSLRQLLQRSRQPSGRVSARLLLILIHGRLRKAERIDPAAKEPEPARAERRSKRVLLYFFTGPAFRALVKKVSRREGETLSSRYRSNGYVPGQNYPNTLEQRVPVVIQH